MRLKGEYNFRRQNPLQGEKIKRLLIYCPPHCMVIGHSKKRPSTWSDKSKHGTHYRKTMDGILHGHIRSVGIITPVWRRFSPKVDRPDYWQTNTLEIDSLQPVPGLVNNNNNKTFYHIFGSPSQNIFLEIGSEVMVLVISFVWRRRSSF